MFIPSRVCAYVHENDHLRTIHTHSRTHARHNVYTTHNYRTRLLLVRVPTGFLISYRPSAAPRATAAVRIDHLSRLGNPAALVYNIISYTSIVRHCTQLLPWYKTHRPIVAQLNCLSHTSRTYIHAVATRCDRNVSCTTRTRVRLCE